MSDNIKKVMIKGTELDKLYETFENIDFRAGEYVPEPEQLQLMVQNLTQYGIFLMWIDDTGDITAENQDIHDIISSVIKKYIVIDNSQ